MKFTKKDIQDGDFDRVIYSKIITGKITQKRFKTLSRWARRNTKRLGNCGHEWDCCGCLCSTFADIEIIGRRGFYYGAKVTYTENFNY